MNALLAEERKKYHHSLLDKGVLTVDKKGIPSNADTSSKLSIAIAKGIAGHLMAEIHEKALGQTSGAKFEQINMEFLSATFPKMQNIRPGRWRIVKLCVFDIAWEEALLWGRDFDWKTDIGLVLPAALRACCF